MVLVLEVPSFPRLAWMEHIGCIDWGIASNASTPLRFRRWARWCAAVRPAALSATTLQYWPGLDPNR